jgi:DNA-binding transcriptional regulator YiaG
MTEDKKKGEKNMAKIQMTIELDSLRDKETIEYLFSALGKDRTMTPAPVVEIQKAEPPNPLSAKRQREFVPAEKFKEIKNKLSMTYKEMNEALGFTQTKHAAHRCQEGGTREDYEEWLKRFKAYKAKKQKWIPGATVIETMTRYKVEKKQVARVLGITPNAVQNWIRDGMSPARYRVFLNALEELKAQKGESNGETV